MNYILALAGVMVLIVLSIINQPGPIVRAIVTPTLGVYLPLALKPVDTPYN
jgi:hypothetical protein